MVCPNAPFEPLTDDTLMTAAPAAIGHAVHDLLGHIEDGVEIGVDNRIPVRLAHLFERCVFRNPGIVDQNVDGADVLRHARDALVA